MNPMVRRTWLLLAAVLALGALQLLEVFSPPQELTSLPAIAPVKREDVQRIRLSSALAEVVIERTGPDSFAITQPFQFAADGARVKAILGALRTGVTPEVQVDSGNFEDYGLNDDKAILVEITGEGVDVAFHLGIDAGGGSSFIRYPDDDAVYRADVGGRVRYDRAAIAWRDHMVTQMAPELIAGLTVVRPGSTTWDLQRETTLGDDPGPWSRASDPEAVLDQVWLDELSERLATLRAGQIVGLEHPAAKAPVVARVRLDLATQERVELAVHAFEDGSWVRRSDREVLYKVADGLAWLLTRPDSALRSRQLFDLPMTAVEFLSWQGPSQTIKLRQDPSSHLWTAVQPRGMSVDLRETIFTARTLSTLRVQEVADVSAEAAGFPSDTRITLTLVNGGQGVLELGGPVPDAPPGQRARYVRRGDQPQRIATMLEEDLSRLERAFGR